MSGKSGNVAPPSEGEVNAPTTVCVFCGSSPGISPAHVAAARELAQVFARDNIQLVYGGGNTGLMGEVARTLVSLVGPQRVHGIIPEALVRYEHPGHVSSESTSSTSQDAANGTDQVAKMYQEYGRISIVPDMHTRKQLMAKAVMEGGPGSGFVALGGGYGTLEELMEMITWNQLGIHKRGVCVLNIEGYYDGLIAWVKSAVTAGFVAPGNAGILVEARTAAQVIDCLREYQVAEGRLQLDWEHK